MACLPQAQCHPLDLGCPHPWGCPYRVCQECPPGLVRWVPHLATGRLTVSLLMKSVEVDSTSKIELANTVLTALTGGSKRALLGYLTPLACIIANACIHMTVIHSLCCKFPGMFMVSSVNFYQASVRVMPRSKRRSCSAVQCNGSVI